MKHIFTTWVPYCTRIRANREPILSSAPPFLKHIYLNKQSSKNLESVSGAARARFTKAIDLPSGFTGKDSPFL